MTWLFVVIALTVSLVRLYPLAVAQWLLNGAERSEQKYQAEMDRYLREVNDKITAMKAHLDATSLDDEMRQYLKKMCDDFEHDLRYDALNSG